MPPLFDCSKRHWIRGQLRTVLPSGNDVLSCPSSTLPDEPVKRYNDFERSINGSSRHSADTLTLRWASGDHCDLMAYYTSGEQNSFIAIFSKLGSALRLEIFVDSQQWREVVGICRSTFTVFFQHFSRDFFSSIYLARLACMSGTLCVLSSRSTQISTSRKNVVKISQVHPEIIDPQGDR